MDRITQVNATQTEEMSGTAMSLLSHSEQLSRLVSRFNLDQNAGNGFQTSTPAITPNYPMLPATPPMASSVFVGNGVTSESGNAFMEF